MKKIILLVVIGCFLGLAAFGYFSRHSQELKASTSIVLTVEVRDGRTQEMIQKGEGEPWTLEEISQSLGMSLKNVVELNDLDQCDIYPGQKLKVMPYSDFDKVWVSWYEDGAYMANGEPFDPDDVHICAHRWLPFGTKVRITCLETGKKAVLEVQDRGPYIEMEERHFDLSRGAAEVLGIRNMGVAQCKIEVLKEKND